MAVTTEQHFVNFKCSNCANTYEINYEQDKHICPDCGSDKIDCSKKVNFCNKWCNDKDNDKDYSNIKGSQS